jgi:hypothetical protein
VSARLRDNWLALVFASAGVWTMVYLGLYGFAWTDFDFEVTPAYDALRGGHLWRFLELVPAYGGAVELRAPFAAAAMLLGGTDQAVFQAVSIPCLIAGALLGVWLCDQLRARGASRLARYSALGLCAANPVTMYACELGHAEELLAAVLCVAALLLAERGRATWAGVALGLAIVTKEWALVAIAPMLLALPAGRRQALALTAGVAAIFYLPFTVAQLASTAGGSTVTALGNAGTIFQPWQLWWFLGAAGHLVRDQNGVILHGYRQAVPWVANLSHPLIVAVSVPLTLLAARFGRAGRGGADPLLVLVLVLLLRFLLDPWDVVYYPLPFIVALTAWEALRLGRPPVLGLLATVGTWLTFEYLPSHVSPDVDSAVFLALALPALGAVSLAIWPWRRREQPARTWRASPATSSAGR